VLHRWALSVDPPTPEVDALARAAERHGVHVTSTSTSTPRVPSAAMSHILSTRNPAMYAALAKT